MGVLYNLARMTTATTGTGTITLGSAVSGYLTFAQAGASSGDVVSYAINDGANSEIGTGTYTTSGTTLTRTVTKSTNSNTAISLSGSAQVFITARAEDFALVPTTQSLTSGTAATYTTPAGCKWLEVFMVGGGGGGGGAKNTATAPIGVAGSNGTASSFNGVTASFGLGSSSDTSPTAGGTGGTGTATRRAQGGAGNGGTSVVTSQIQSTNPSGSGGVSYFGGNGPGVQGANAGIAAAANSGSGGGGGANNASASDNVMPGGSAGEFAYLIIGNPSATYTYTVGVGGAGGVSASNGGRGGDGFIFVIEHYGSG